MSAYQVAVVADDAAPATGAAVVRIAGLKSWPENATLRILPIDEAAVPPNSEGWPWQAIRPVRVSETDAGVDVVLGPEVVNSARLLPGTPITIKIGAANLEVEARWPAVATTSRRRAGAVAMSATQLLAAKAEREKLERAAATRRQELAAFAAKSAREAATESELSRTKAQPAPGRDSPSRMGETGQLARLVPMRRPDAAAKDLPLGAPNVAGGSLGQLAKLGTAPPGNVVPMPTAPTHTTEPPKRLGWLRGFVAGFATMAALGAAVLAFAPTNWLPSGITGGRNASGAGAQLNVVDLQNIFKDLASTGSMSPRRKSAANVDVATALSLADHSLRGQRTEAETEEAEFWLKRALSTSFAGQDIGWALTQLGTIYATAGTPHHSYVKAHTIWELAAAQGDPVAHCFLGALYEHGLGVTADRVAARDHYVTADALGACRSAKEAAARLSK